MPDLDEIFAAQSDQHAVTLAVRMAGNLLFRVPNSVREAKLLLAHVMGKPLHDLGMADMTTEAMDRLAVLCEARNSGTPMSHLLGARDFWNHRFQVTPDVLDPRPETEILVEAALQVPFASVLDLGTGSGCILLSLLAERGGATGVGADVSKAALDVARRNAADIGVAQRCTLVLSDWFTTVEGSFDLILSNPPYIALEEMAGLSAELSFEPRMALTDEGDGLSCYRRICDGVDPYLNANGWLMVEIGPTQGDSVAAMMQAVGLTNIRIQPDLDGRDRVVLGQKAL